MSLTASQIYASSQGVKCIGQRRCHWCAAPCTEQYICYDDPVVLFEKRKSTAKLFGEPYLCIACWNFQRPRTTVPFLHGGLVDGKAPRDYSWWITPSNAWGITPIESADKMYALLLDPPRCFVLALLEGSGYKNDIHLALANEPEELKADTPLHFTINNVPHSYTTYELREALKGKQSGREPGVHAIMRWLGPYNDPTPEVKRERGRPPKTEPDDGKITQKVHAMSGGIRRR